MTARFAVLLLSVLQCLAPHWSYAQDEWQGISTIVAVGDLHGDYDHYIKVLEMNALINSRGHWSAGKTHLVQLGDIPDRGPDSLKIIQHLQKISKQANRAGGYVHALIGNHEAMNIEGDLRYVHPGEYQTLVTRKSADAQREYLARVFGYMLQQQPELMERKEETLARLEEQFPLGYVEHRRLWQPGQEIAKWVAGHNAIIKINRTLFVHGGIDPHRPLKPIGELNAEISRLLSIDTQFQPNLANDENGPLWYRGLAQHTAEEELEPLKAMLKFYDASRMVVAHTTTKGEIVSRFDGMVIMVDVGISSAYGGHLANLLIEGDKLFSVTPGKTTALDLQEE